MLARAIVDTSAEVLYAGPVAALGLEGGGTPAEVRAFVAHLEDIRARVGRPVAFLLIAHENKAGQVSGAWKGATDTLAHVQAQGNGRTRVHWSKARRAPGLHGRLHSLWRDGETFELEDKPEITDDAVLEALLAFLAENPGASRGNKFEKADAGKGVSTDRKRDAVDSALERGDIVDANALRRQLTGKGGNGMSLYLADDPTIAHLFDEVRPDSGEPQANLLAGPQAARKGEARRSPRLRGELRGEPHPPAPPTTSKSSNGSSSAPTNGA